MRIIIGIIIIVIGALITIYYEQMMRTFGRVAWAEKHLGSSRTFYQYLGVLIAMLGMFITFNLHERILYAIFAPLFRF